jgi:hypothetical protein
MLEPKNSDSAGERCRVFHLVISRFFDRRFQESVLDDATSLNHSDQENDDGDYQKNVNESTHGGAGYEAQQPENDEDESDSH